MGVQCPSREIVFQVEGLSVLTSSSYGCDDLETGHLGPGGKESQTWEVRFSGTPLLTSELAP